MDVYLLPSGGWLCGPDTIPRGEGRGHRWEGPAGEMEEDAPRGEEPMPWGEEPTPRGEERVPASGLENMAWLKPV